MPKTKTLKPTTARVKPLKPRGKQAGWKCGACGSTNADGEVFCKCGALTPALIGIERALADVLAPNEGLAVRWPMMRETGASDEGLRAIIIGALRWYEFPRAVCEPFRAIWEPLDDEGAEPRIWFVEGPEPSGGKLPKRDPDFAGAALIAAVRSIFGIGEPSAVSDQPTAKAEGGKRKAEKPAAEPASGGNPKSKIDNPKSTAGPVVRSESCFLAVATIRVTNSNPRKHFDQDAHTRLVESIKADGLLQALAVRPIGDGSFELLAGERRLRAAKSAGLNEVPALVRYDVDDAKAARIRLAENYVRENLNPIEEAEAFRALLDEHGFTQRELAEYFGLSQGKIANDVRMLKLPEVWRERVISGEITKSTARLLATWADVPSVLEDVEEKYQRERPIQNGQPVPISADDFEQLLVSSIEQQSRPLSGSEHIHGRGWVQVRISKKDRERADLQVRDVPVWGGKTEPRAFNVALWDELQNASEARAAKTNNPKSAIENPKSAETPAQRREKAQRKADQHRRRLEDWYHEWLQQLILARINELDVVADLDRYLKIALYFAAQSPATRRAEELLAACPGKRKGGGGAFAAVWPALDGLSALTDVRGVLRDAVRLWLQHPIDQWNSDLSPAAVRGIAADVGVSLETDWKLTREFLELHDRQQIAAIAKEWKVGHLLALARTRREEIDALLSAGTDFAPPKALAKLVKGLR